MLASNGVNVVTRFPPSPTGSFHLGSARTALFNYLFAAHTGGTMYLRFEDTDVARSKREHEDDIREGLQWLGITYELPKVFRQSERTHTYRTYLEQLMEKGLAYEAEASDADPHKKVIRFKNPNVPMTFNDLIRGDISFDTKELEDFVIARSIKDPLYHLSVVIDDYEMGVTHVIRGEDHISNTPRQILILEALGFPRPLYAHIPLILASDRSKLSKRHGALSVNEYRAEGYLPEAFVNYLALLGWNPGGDQEIFSIQELKEKFSLEHVQKSGAIFDVEKLRWFNKEYLKKIPDDLFAAGALPVLKSAALTRGFTWDEKLALRLLPLVRERISTWHDIAKQVDEGEFDYFFYDPRPAASDIPHKNGPQDAASLHLQAILHSLKEISNADFMSTDVIKRALWDYATAHGRGDVLWPFRYALSGRARSADPMQIAAIIGKESTERRLYAAIKILRASS